MRRIIRVSTAPARKSKYSRSASLATDARAEAEESNGLPPVAAPDNPKYGGRYFVDFRARTAASYGHAFLWYGRLKQDGKVGAIEVAGLHPATDSVVPYILGHIIPVPSETGKSYGDLDEQYLTASYRVYLTEAQARNVFAYIKQKQASSPIWQAGTVNCTGFISDVASYMGLRTPALPTLMYPEDLVKAIKELTRIIQPVDPLVAQTGVGVTGLRFRRFPDTPLLYRRRASMRIGVGLRVDGNGWMSGASRPACHVTRRGIRASA